MLLLLLLLFGKCRAGKDLRTWRKVQTWQPRPPDYLLVR